jgi:hypothetical protein
VRDGGGAARDRIWLADQRVPPRHLQVSRHSDQSIIVLSIWNQNVCTATFQLPVADAPAMIEVLVGALADAAQQPAATAIVTPPRWLRIRAWARSKLTRSA